MSVSKQHYYTEGVDNTMQASITKTAEGDILNQYQNEFDPNKYSTTPNNTVKPDESNSGSGIDAALGTNYSWDTQAQERAEKDYQSAILESKNNFLESRKEIESQGIQNQELIALQDYSQNQSTEKAGWTGGYVLDTERQVNYLKETIKAQMYGQMELQRYGYDTALAAARLAYETNKYDLALQYYNTALQRAVTEAEMTGYYVSPEVSEMLNQYSIASQALNKGEDVERNEAILSNIYDWFNANGISKQGVKTWAKMKEDREWDLSMKKVYMDMYAGAFTDASGTQLDKDLYIMKGPDGEFLYTDKSKTTFKVFNFEKSTAQEVMDYVNNDTTGTAKQQFYSRIDALSYQMELDFETHCRTEGLVSDKDKGTTKDLVEELKKWLKKETTMDLFKKEISKYSGYSNEETLALFGDYEVEFSLPNGGYATLFFGPDNSSKQEPSTDTGNSGTGNQESSDTTEGTSSGAGTSSSVGIAKLSSHGTTVINYGDKSVIQGDNGETFDPEKDGTLTKLSTQTSPASLVRRLEGSDKYQDIAMLLGDSEINDEIDKVTRFGDTEELMDSVMGGAAGLSTTAALLGISTKAAALGPYGWILSLACILIAGGVNIAQDFIGQKEAKQAFDDSSKALADIHYAVGTENLELIKQAHDTYANLSSEEIDNLSANDRKTLEKLYHFHRTYEQLKEINTWASKHDTHMFSTEKWSWDYTQDKAAQTADYFKDGNIIAGIASGIGCGIGAVGEFFSHVGKEIGSWFS